MSLANSQIHRDSRGASQPRHQQYRVSHHELMRQIANGMAVAPPPDMGWTFTLLSGAILWLLRDATLRRLEGEPAPPVYRPLLWTAVAISGLFALATGGLAVAGVYDKHGYGFLVTLMFGPLSFGAAACSWALAWYARYPFPERPAGSPSAPASAD